MISPKGKYPLFPPPVGSFESGDDDDEDKRDVIDSHINAEGGRARSRSFSI